MGSTHELYERVAGLENDEASGSIHEAPYSVIAPRGTRRILSRPAHEHSWIRRVTLEAKQLLAGGAVLIFVAVLCLFSARQPRPPGRAPNVQDLPGALGAVEEKIEVASNPVTISWTKHPEKCLDVAGGRAQNGNVIALWGCDTSRNKQLLVPAPGRVGHIRNAQHPEMCLDAPGGCELMWWSCDKGNNQNMLFIMPEGNVGLIRVSGRPNQCIDVPGGHSENGQRLQIWNCSTSHNDNMELKISPISPMANSDCVWGVWSSWTACSQRCGGGLRSRSRAVLREQTGSGKACEGTVTQVKTCHATQCCNNASGCSVDSYNSSRAVQDSRRTAFRLKQMQLPSWPKERGGSHGLSVGVRAVLLICIIRLWQWLPS